MVTNVTICKFVMRNRGKNRDENGFKFEYFRYLLDKISTLHLLSSQVTRKLIASDSIRAKLLLRVGHSKCFSHSSADTFC